MKKRTSNRTKNTTGTQKQFTKGIPFLIKKELDTLDYPRIDNLYIILDLIYSKTFYFKTKAQREYSFTQIPFSIFKQYLGKFQHIQEDINWLVDNGYIIRNNYYNPEEGCSKGYKIAEEYLSRKVYVKITCPKINKKIINVINEMKKQKVARLELAQSGFFKNFKINKSEAISYVENLTRQEIKSLCYKIGFPINQHGIDELMNCEGNFITIKKRITSIEGGKELYDILHRRNHYDSLIHKISEGYLYFKRNSRNGRLDTNLTCLPKFLRPFIQSEEDLYSIDIKSSQPFFLYTLIKDVDVIPTEEKEFYKSMVVSGGTDIGIYEFLAGEYEKVFKVPCTREQMKTRLFKMFYSKPESFAKLKGLFSIHFPNINKYINKLKENDYKDFSVILQNIESSLVLDKVLKNLQDKGVISYTIHDSFICKESVKDVVADTLKEYCSSIFGCSPNLHIDCITQIPVEEVVEDFDIDEDWIEDVDTKIDDIDVESIEVIELPRLTNEEIKKLILN